MPSPEATFDSLAITSDLQELAKGATSSEVTLFSYLSCLLFVYRGSPASEWGYGFSATQSYAPYSDELSTGIALLVRSRFLAESEHGLRVTSAGADELLGLAGLKRFSDRLLFIRAATSSALAIPLPQVGASLTAEPELRRALELSSTRPLLDDSGIGALHDHFVALAEAVPERSDLLTPAVVWLSYLGSTLDGVDVRSS